MNSLSKTNKYINTIKFIFKTQFKTKMPEKIVKTWKTARCPECKTILRVYGKSSFKHCKGLHPLKGNLVIEPDKSQDAEAIKENALLQNQKGANQQVHSLPAPPALQQLSAGSDLQKNPDDAELEIEVEKPRMETRTETALNYKCGNCGFEFNEPKIEMVYTIKKRYCPNCGVEFE